MLIILFKALTESQNLSMFLAKQGSIREELKKAMEKIKECLHKIGNLAKFLIILVENIETLFNILQFTIP